MAPRFLITGSLGWLGKRLTRLLATGGLTHPVLRGLPGDAKIRCLILPGQEDGVSGGELRLDGGVDLRAMGNVEVVAGDLRNPADCRAFCAGAEGALLLHTAGVIHPRRVSEFSEINVRGTENLLQAAQDAKVSRVMAVSSNSPLGNNPHSDHLFDEESPYHPYRGYGRSKMLMEQTVERFRNDGKIQTVVIRPPWFYGPDQPPRQTLFFTMIKQGRGPIVGSGENLRSMAYVDNLCQGVMLAAVQPQAAGQTYWIADRRPYSMNQIVDTVERLLEQEFHMTVAHQRLRLPSIAAEIAGVADATLQALGIYQQKIHVLSEMNKTIACTIAKAVRELDYQPEVELEEGMRRSISWCLERGISI
jgi:nucleoside-diphosphate-sugar epimerase